ncbi:MAG: glycerophosphoryl diester phosphodiesterase membrane domain-containing protein [Candidatus Eiseniibacteriota bacterium]
MGVPSGHLRPRSLSELLDAAVRHYRARFLPFLLPFLPMAALDVVGIAMFASFLLFVATLGEAAEPDLAAMGGFLGWIALLGVFFAVRQAAFVLGFGAAVLQAGNDLAGRSLTLREAWMQSGSRFWPAVGAGIFYMVFVVLGTLFLIVPGIWLSIRLALAGHALFLEGAGSWGAISRSDELMRGAFWRGAGVALVVLVVNMGLGTVSTVLQEVGALFLDEEGELGTGFYALTGASFVVATVIGLLLTPLFTLLYTHFYWDLRVRKEGLDLDTQLSRLETASS